MSGRVVSESFAISRDLVDQGELLVKRLRNFSPDERLNGSVHAFGAEVVQWFGRFEELVDNPAFQVSGRPKAILDVPQALSTRLWELESVLGEWVGK